MTDIVRRLRYEADVIRLYPLAPNAHEILTEAADEIVRLRALADMPTVPEPTGQPW